MTVVRDAVMPGQVSVWDLPRPAVAEFEPLPLRIEHGGRIIAVTSAGVRTLETSHPPSYYFPPDSIAVGVLRPSTRHSFCEWKGHAVYFDVDAGGQMFRDAAWSYPAPTVPFELLRDHIAFYADPFDGCFVGDERATPQPGGFYGGWITPRYAGPFKGVPGSRFW